MSTVERTYSFRAPAKLADRLAAARESVIRIAGEAPEVEEWLVRELEIALARRLRAAPELTRDQSAFMRGAVELLVGVTEKVAHGLELSREYAAARREDREATAFIDGAVDASRATWKE